MSITTSDVERPDARLSAETMARASRHDRRAFVITFDPKPDPCRAFDWSAIDADSYDGAPDSGNRHQVGHGATAEAALTELLGMIEP